MLKIAIGSKQYPRTLAVQVKEIEVSAAIKFNKAYTPTHPRAPIP